MTEYWIRIEGHLIDLESCALNFRDPAACAVVVRDDDQHYLRAAEIDQLSGSDVILAKAEEIIERINGLMRIQRSDYQHIRSSGNYLFENEEGKHLHIVTFAAQMTTRSSMGAALTVDGDEAEPPEPEGLRAEYEQAKADPEIDEAVRGFGAAEDLAELYKIYEIIRHFYRGARQMLDRLAKDERDRQVLAEREDHFTRSAQPERHARWPGRAPETPMSVREGQAFVRDLLQRHLEFRRR